MDECVIVHESTSPVCIFVCEYICTVLLYMWIVGAYVCMFYESFFFFLLILTVWVSASLCETLEIVLPSTRPQNLGIFMAHIC